MMRWEDERYVRFYTRDTPEWLALSWQARGLFGLILRAVDRAGTLPVGKLGKKGVAVAVHAPWADVDGPLAELLEDGCIVWDEGRASFLIRNYLDAQECAQSDAARKRASRERARAQFGGGSEASEKARAALGSQIVTADSGLSQIVTDKPPGNERRTAANGSTRRDAERRSASDSLSVSQNVTACGHEQGLEVTNGHDASRSVTPCLAVPYRAVPEEQKTLAQSAEKPPTAPSAFASYVAAEWPDLNNPAKFEARAREAFPGVDPLAEAKKARGWELSEPKNRKRKHGSFLWRWLTKAQTDAGKNGSRNGACPPNLHVDNDALNAEPPGRKFL